MLPKPLSTLNTPLFVCHESHTNEFKNAQDTKPT
jgi:hypothetical protein